MRRIPVYFVPGLGANSLIFEFIKLPEDEFECIYLEWELPQEKDSITDYAMRMAKKIHHEHPVLIGVSLGGLMVQEMMKFLEPEKVIIISSAKSNKEYPRLFKFAKYTKIYKLVPTTLLIKMGALAKFPIFGRKINERLRLYKRYLGVKETRFWRWAIEQIMLWNRNEPDDRVIHIHGIKDEVFPAKRIKNFIPIDDGTHVMLIIRHKWLTEHLPKIIKDENGKLN